jgi:5'-nucleotidase
MEEPSQSSLPNGCIFTYSGIHFRPLDPRPKDIRIDDIGHALAHQCRFGGHTRRFYSIAQHSIFVSQLCRSEDALWGLLHDASEAYLQDVCRTLKAHDEFRAYRAAESRLQRCIVQRFGLAPEQPASVTLADDRMLAVEYRDLMTPVREYYVAIPPAHVMVSVTNPWQPEEAEREFQARFEELFRR